MSDPVAMSEEGMSSPSSNNTSSIFSKGLNLSKDFISADQVSPEMYKNNNNNIEDTSSVSPSSARGGDISNSYSVDISMIGGGGEEKLFKRRDSLSDECNKMNVSPKDRERSVVDDEDNMQFSPKSATEARSESGSSENNRNKYLLQQDVEHHSSPSSHHLATSLQKRPIFGSESLGGERDHSSSEYTRANHAMESSHQLRGSGEHQSLPADFVGGGSENNEEMSDNEEMICDDYESDSESNEPRITVREALMNRALAAAAAAAAATSSATSHFAGGGSAGERSGEIFSSDQGGSGRTSRSGGVSPSQSPPGVHSSSASGFASGRNENSLSVGSLLSKEPFVNGHSALRPPVSHQHSGERYHGHSHGHQQQHQSQHHRSSYGAHHGHQTGHGSHTKHSQSFRDPVIKSESKSHSSSPLQPEVKPENLAALSNLSNIQSSIGNALLNLASLGSLAALQQSLPGLLSSVGGTGSSSGGGNNGPGSSPSHTSPHTSGVGGSSSSPSSMNTPLNLTHSSVGGSSSAVAKSHHHHHHSTSNNGNHSRSQHSSSPSVSQFSHQSPFSHSGNSLSGGAQGSMLGAGGGLIPPSLASYFAQSAGSGGSGSSPSPLIPSASQLSSSLSQAAASAQTPGSLPQLVLASGQIMQGIQGAQLLIPTSQGIMTQMILTIPLTQPGSPQSLMNAVQAQNTSPAIGAVSGQSSSSPHSRNSRHPNRSHHHGLPQCSANSPPIGSTVPPSASPDFSGPGGAMSSSLLNLSPHLVNQSLGAHIPLDKMGMDRSGSMNGIRNSSSKRDISGSVISSNPNLPMSALYPPKMSPCSGSGHDSDKCSDAGDSDQMVDGINLDEIKEFAKAFKLRRLSLGLTQTQVGQALSVTEGPAYSQSAICSALAWQLAQSQSQLSQSNRTSLPQPPMFEKLDITPKSAQKIKPVLERWMKEAEDRYKNGHHNLNEFVGMEPSKKRKRRTSFTPQALEILNVQFERNTHPSGAEITTLAHQLGYEREVIRIWFCNKRQALKNTVRMMSKGSSPI